MTDPEKITIIEGPAPTFEFTLETWLPGMVESPSMPRLAMCRVRTSNGPALVERCHRAWHETRPAYLEYRAGDGTTREAQLLAARNVEVDEGDLLILWVRLPEEEVALELDVHDDEGADDGTEDFDFPPDR